MKPGGRSAPALALLLALGGCGGGSGDAPPPPPPPPPPPAAVSLAITGDTAVAEANNPKVQVSVALSAAASGSVSVQLSLAGSAARGSDYEIDRDSVTVPAGATSATVEIDVYRDFDEEGDETIEVSLGAIAGNARASDDAPVTLTVRDGEAAAANKMPDDAIDGGETPALGLQPLAYTVTGEAVLLVVAAMNPLSSGESAPLVAEWSNDERFQGGVREIARIDIESTDDPFELFLGNVHQFSVPVSELSPNEVYFIRAWLGQAPPAGEFGAEYANMFFNGFVTDAEGRVLVRCEAPQRTASGIADPLLAEQWHMANTGQTAYSDRGGAAGADLRMSGALAAGHTGEGIKLAVVDTGLETCHPDLAANADGKGSFNFGYERMAGAGAREDEPFHFGLLGDHGTSVAGIAAAVAGNGLGGRGVAPDVTLVGFNPMEALGGDGEPPGEDVEPGEVVDAVPAQDELPDEFSVALLQSLGASASEPDSASVDIFNMSFGTFAPAENAQEEFVRLFRMGTSELRGGRGALYVKAAGNEFDHCHPIHPLNLEVGCLSANSDPDQNLPWLIVVGGFNADDVKASYSVAGANLWVVGPSGEDGEAAPAMITTDQAGAYGGYSRYSENRLPSTHPLNPDGDYVSAFSGTSAAAPAVAGALAVLLGANPDLTWRDVRYILARTARTIDPGRAEVRAAFGGTPYVAQHAWQTNAAGYDFHNWYGFGAVDMDAAVALAASHAPDSLGTFVESEWVTAAAAAELPLAIPDADGAGAAASIEVTGLPGAASIEAVVLEIGVDHANAADLGISLRSPAGTSSVLNPPFNDGLRDAFGGFRDWRLLSNAFYGENPNGTWTVHVADLAAEDTGSLTGWRLRFYYGEHPR